MNQLIEYIRDKNGNKRGVVLATKNNSGEIRIGYSKISSEDSGIKFDRDFAKGIANARANLYPISAIMNRTKNCGFSPYIQRMLIRSAKYFKDGKLDVSPETTEIFRNSTY